ncbi:cyclin-I-like [Sinocyclocheilus rhinocerous]|uniref:cyclin-I-like n=1 Tax=Sinocyclocheilus rhinocerous TaxID=307959 RepID=UPI0007B95E5D|nr:PREDICTED: cyclin-I-like [Sinocyclocheilus rhinocerous]
MKFTLPLESRKLSSLLEKAVSREAKLWKAYVPKKPTNQDTDISPEKRDEAVRWLRDVHSQLKLCPETLCLAIGILDRFLSAVKARPKYLRCIAISCFFLAVKTSEENERIPSLRELASSSKCGCSPSEILRMERIVLDKLNWDLHSTTALDFLYICISSSFSFGFLFQIDSSQLIGCRELVARCLSTHTASLPPNTVYICHPPPNALEPRDGGVLPPWHVSPASTAPSDPNTTHTRACKSSAKRKVEHMEVDEYFDGIKRLYNEESPQEGAPTCTAETQQNAGSSPCPPLQPVRET